MTRSGIVYVLCALGLLIGRPVMAAPADSLEAWRAAPALHGMTGLVTTPTAQVLPSGALRLGFGYYDEDWGYHARGLSENYHYFLTFGFVSRVEVSIRASYFPDDQLDDATEERGTVDRGGNARLLLLREGNTLPAVAVGIDDIRGTRRFHALYAVGTKSFVIKPKILRLTVSGGYAPDWLEAKDHVIFGGFGGAEVGLGDFASWAIDYDTEKWNTSFRLYAFRRVTAYLALLNFEGSAGGVSWTHQF